MGSSEIHEATGGWSGEFIIVLKLNLYTRLIFIFKFHKTAMRVIRKFNPSVAKGVSS